MKKNLLLSFLVWCIGTCLLNAQIKFQTNGTILKVEADGTVNIGRENCVPQLTVDSNGAVQVNKVYSNIYHTSGSHLGIISTSDANLKTNIREISSITERVLKLRPVTYNFVKNGNGEDVSKDLAYQNRTGFIAQEVKEIFPDLVVEVDRRDKGVDKNGNIIEKSISAEKVYSLDYAGLIPYLVKTIQEQNEKIENLQKQINDIQTDVHMANFTIDVAPSTVLKQQTQQIAKDKENNILHQNTPNPFNYATKIKYELADNATNVKICIYNLTGKQLQCYNMPAAKGESTIEVSASSLQSGMYLYSLIVDGRVIDTKRMILTE
jgi:hypothetical protein